jgi:hypothetical protein
MGMRPRARLRTTPRLLRVPPTTTTGTVDVSVISKAELAHTVHRSQNARLYPECGIGRTVIIQCIMFNVLRIAPDDENLTAYSASHRINASVNGLTGRWGIFLKLNSKTSPVLQRS